MRLLIVFALALKNVEIGAFEEADALFGEFESAKLTKTGMHRQLFEHYQGLIENCRHDMEITEELANMDVEGMDKPALEARVESLKQTSFKTLLTRGPKVVSDKVFMCLSKVAELDEASQPIASNPDPDKDPPNGGDGNDQSPSGVGTFAEELKKLDALVKGRDFKGLRESLTKINFPNEGDRNKRVKYLDLLSYAEAYYGNFYVNLEGKRLGNVQIKDSAGKAYQVEAFKREGVVGIADGARSELKWQVIDPESLLRLHQLLSQSVEAEFIRNRLLENAACFAYITGVEQVAKNASDKLSGRDSVFKRRWEEAMITLRY